MQQTERQLQALADLQRHLLPRTLPQLPGWRLAAHYIVGQWPGGDYYDFLTLPDGRLFLLVADASDQGAPSAALVAMVRVLLHSCPLSSGVDHLPFCPIRDPVLQPPHILLGRFNRILWENSLADQFLTAFCGILDPLDGNFHFANAGHPYPRWWRAATGTVESIRDAAGLPLAMDHHTAYHHKRIEIEPGDVLVFYSDGLTAALNPRGQAFGCERLDQALRQTAADGAAAVKAAVLDSLEEFLGGKGFRDDVTLVILERKQV